MTPLNMRCVCGICARPLETKSYQLCFITAFIFLATVIHIIFFINWKKTSKYIGISDSSPNNLWILQLCTYLCLCVILLQLFSFRVREVARKLFKRWKHQLNRDMTNEGHQPFPILGSFALIFERVYSKVAASSNSDFFFCSDRITPAFLIVISSYTYHEFVVFFSVIFWNLCT